MTSRKMCVFRTARRPIPHNALAEAQFIDSNKVCPVPLEELPRLEALVDACRNRKVSFPSFPMFVPSLSWQILGFQATSIQSCAKKTFGAPCGSALPPPIAPANSSGRPSNSSGPSSNRPSSNSSQPTTGFGSMRPTASSPSRAPRSPRSPSSRAGGLAGSSS